MFASRDKLSPPVHEFCACGIKKGRKNKFYVLLLICGAVHNRMTSQESNKNLYCIVVSHAL